MSVNAPLPTEHTIKPENLNEPSTIRVVALVTNFLKTQEDHVTAQGFGYSSPLEKPVQVNETAYKWEGLLHPNAAERQAPKSREGYRGASNIKNSVTELAENFAQNADQRQNPTLQLSGKDSYTFNFEPLVTEDAVKTLPDHTKMRALDSQEQDAFLRAYEEAKKKLLASHASR